MDSLKGWKLNTDTSRLAKPGATCSFCKECDDSELLFGKFYKIGRINCHHFCLLLSSKLVQRGRDDQGILGFLYDDIMVELRRVTKSKCYFCGWSCATLSCDYEGCKKIFHLPCGRRNGALNLFADRFQSYCKDHRPMQQVPVSIFYERSSKGTETLVIPLKRIDHPHQRIDDIIKKTQDCSLSTSQEEEPIHYCAICYDDIVPYPTAQSIWPECCRKDKWLHRICVAKLALSAGKYHVRCPHCNNQPIFLNMIYGLGFYVPDQDASWELEDGAFQELLQRPKDCFREDCVCPKGRKFVSTGNGPWKLLVCGLCGSQAVHKGCYNSNGRSKAIVCSRCIPSPSHQNSNPENLDSSSVMVIDDDCLSVIENVSVKQSTSNGTRRLPPRSHLVVSKEYVPDHLDESRQNQQKNVSNTVEENKLEIISSLSKMLKNTPKPTDCVGPIEEGITNSRLTPELVPCSTTVSSSCAVSSEDHSQTHSLISQLSNTIKQFKERNRTKSIDSGLDLHDSTSDVSFSKENDDEIVVHKNDSLSVADCVIKEIAHRKENKLTKKVTKLKNKKSVSNHKVKIISKRLGKRYLHRVDGGVKHKMRTKKNNKFSNHDVNNKFSNRDKNGKFKKRTNVDEYFNNLEKMETAKLRKGENESYNSSDVSISLESTNITSGTVIDLTNSNIDNITEFNNHISSPDVSKSRKKNSAKITTHPDKCEKESNVTKKHSKEKECKHNENEDKHKKKSYKRSKLNTEISKSHISSSEISDYKKRECKNKSKSKVRQETESECKKNPFHFMKSKNKESKEKASSWVAGKPREGVNVVLKDGKFCILDKDGYKVKVKELIQKGRRESGHKTKEGSGKLIKKSRTKDKNMKYNDGKVECNGVDSAEISIKLNTKRHKKHSLEKKANNKSSDIRTFFTNYFKKYDEDVKNMENSYDKNNPKSTLIKSEKDKDIKLTIIHNNNDKHIPECVSDKHRKKDKKKKKHNESHYSHFNKEKMKISGDVDQESSNHVTENLLSTFNLNKSHHSVEKKHKINSAVFSKEYISETRHESKCSSSVEKVVALTDSEDNYYTRVNDVSELSRSKVLDCNTQHSKHIRKQSGHKKYKKETTDSGSAVCNDVDSHLNKSGKRGIDKIAAGEEGNEKKRKNKEYKTHGGKGRTSFNVISGILRDMTESLNVISGIDCNEIAEPTQGVKDPYEIITIKALRYSRKRRNSENDGHYDLHLGDGTHSNKRRRNTLIDQTNNVRHSENIS